MKSSNRKVRKYNTTVPNCVITPFHYSDKLDEIPQRFDLKRSSHSNGGSKKNGQYEEHQPDLLPSNESTAFKNQEEPMVRPSKKEVINPRSRYNTNVQKYLKEKYGSVRTNNKNTNKDISGKNLSRTNYNY